MSLSMALKDHQWIFIEKITSMGLSIFSTSCVVIHLHKVFQTRTPQSLLTKYLAFYCFFLLLIYMFTFIRGVVFLMEPYYSHMLRYYEIGYFIVHLMSTATFIKFIIAMDLFWCFRKIAIYQQTPFLETGNKKFIVYCLLGASIPAVYTLILKSFAKDPEWHTVLASTMAIMRIVRLFFIIGTFWYIRSAGMNRQELWSKYSLHIRILIMIGGMSSIMTIVEVFSMMNQDNNVKHRHDTTKPMTQTVYFWINFLGYFLEGMYIRMLITFRKDNFHSTTTKVPCQTNKPNYKPSSLTQTFQDIQV